MSAWVALSSAGLSAAGVLTALLAALLTRDLRAGLPMMLELWTAAGLLRLSGAPEVSTVAAAAAVVLVRTLVNASLKRSMRRGGRKAGLLAALLLCCVPRFAEAQGAAVPGGAEAVPETEPDVELAKQLANPLASLVSIPFIFDAETRMGSDESAYDWDRNEGNLPIGLVLAKLLRIGSSIVSLGGGARYWAVASEDGAHGFNLRLQMALVLPNKRVEE